MADYTHTGIELVGLHVPEPGSETFRNMQEAREAGHDVINPVTGMYHFGALVDGAFVPLVSEKASLVFDRIDAARQAAQDQAAADQAAAAQADTGPQSTYSYQPTQQG